METWQEEIPYTTETTTSNEYTVGTKKTVQNGVNGLRQITAQRVYNTDGIQLSQKILSTEVVQEPVTEKIVKGTKKVTSSTSYITGSGQFIWPVPGYRNCSRWYGGSHKGVDICAAAGTPIYASAGGTVTKAGYNKAGAGTGYGYSIIISHGSGYTTVYAHCLSLAVHSGQTVKQGQLIGYVGSTGRSSGNHCHFEIRRNGSYIAPQNVFNRRSIGKFAEGFFSGEGPSAVLCNRKGEMILCLPLTSVLKRRFCKDRPDAGRSSACKIHCGHLPQGCASGDRRARHAWLYRHLRGPSHQRDGQRHGYAVHRHLFL